MEQKQLNIEIGHSYPAPVVDLEKASKFARETLWQTKKSAVVKQHNTLILRTLSGRKHEDEEGA
jgi:deoxyribodipyrimidine photo-lyase